MASDCVSSWSLLIFYFDSVESVDSQWAILYMYNPCMLYMNNVGWVRLVER